MDEAEPRSRERLDPLRRTETCRSGRGWRPRPAACWTPVCAHWWLQGEIPATCNQKNY